MSRTARKPATPLAASDAETGAALTDALRLLGDATRLKLLLELGCRERAVKELQAMLGMPQPQVSQHLCCLRAGGLVNTRRAGKLTYYSAVTPAPGPGTIRVLTAGGAVELATGRLPSWNGLAIAMRALADGTRRRLLVLLGEGEANVGSLCARLELPTFAVSHHLAILRFVRMVETRREGRNIYYRLAGPSRGPGMIRIEAAGGAVVTVATA